MENRYLYRFQKYLQSWFWNRYNKTEEKLSILVPCQELASNSHPLVPIVKRFLFKKYLNLTRQVQGNLYDFLKQIFWTWKCNYTWFFAWNMHEYGAYRFGTQNLVPCRDAVDFLPTHEHNQSDILLFWIWKRLGWEDSPGRYFARALCSHLFIRVKKTVGTC